MKRNNAEQIGKLIQQFLRQESLESPLNEQRGCLAANTGTDHCLIHSELIYKESNIVCTSDLSRPSSGIDDGA